MSGTKRDTEDALSGTGFPYIVIHESEEGQNVWAPVWALNAAGAVLMATEDEPREYPDDAEFTVYSLGTGPEGNVHPRAVTGDEI